MPNKDSKEKTCTTLSAVEQSTQAVARAAVSMSASETRFESDPSPANWAAVQEARAEHTYQTRVNDITVAAHVAAAQVETERLAAEAEQQRIEQLAAVQKDIDANVASSILAAEALAAGLRISWEKAILSQGLGGSPINSWNYDVQAGLSQALVREGFPAHAIRIG